MAEAATAAAAAVAAAARTRVTGMFGLGPEESLTPMVTVTRTGLRWRRTTTPAIVRVGVQITMPQQLD